MADVFVVSDLHWFSRRSTAPQHMPAIVDAVRKADVFVLNGDIFDFRWTTLSCIEDTVDEALRWLKGLMSHNPRCRYHYVLGNHDGVRLFIDTLRGFARGKPNLDWHAWYLRLGDAAFLHGDVARRNMGMHALKKRRVRWLYDTKKGRMRNWLYDVAFASGVVNRVYRLAYPTETVVPRLVHYLEDVGEGPDAGTRSVYFGHTHVPVAGYEYRGVRFHNGGAAMPGTAFRILNTEVAL